MVLRVPLRTACLLRADESASEALEDQPLPRPVLFDVRRFHGDGNRNASFAFENVEGSQPNSPSRQMTLALSAEVCA